MNNLNSRLLIALTLNPKRNCELKYEVKVTLIHLGVRSFTIKISMCWVITCSIVRILLLKKEYS
jgi:hypothetical protein